MALDKRIRFLLWVGAKTGHAFDPKVDVAALRAAYTETNRRFGLARRTGIATRDFEIRASDGGTIGARLYRPGDLHGHVLPVLLYFHGGGFVIGDIAGYDGLASYFAERGRLAVLSVEYRLAPEHRFPRGHDDAFEAYAWLRRNAEQLEIDPARVAVGGDSAGGTLAAAIACYAESRGLAAPAFAFLIYPSVDGTGRFPSRSQYRGNLPLTPATIDWFVARAVRGRADLADPLFSPLDAPQPERHPPAYVLAAQYDPLVDEGRAYFERLRDAGVAVAYDLRPTLPHAFLNLARVVPEARRAIESGIEATAIALGALPAKVCALTGAGSGIGRALALELARENYTLALADRDRDALEETARIARERAPVSTHVVDVADRAAVDAFARDVVQKYGRVDLLVNNAGVALAGNVAELTVEEIAWLMNVNFWGTIYGVKAFLPSLERSSDATIVNLSSVFGLIGPPGQSAYAASKFAIRGFSESLREELRGSVHVLTVHPGGVKTNIARASRIAAAADQELHRGRAAAFEERLLTLTPETAAREIVRAILQKRERLLIGRDARRIDALARILGSGAAKVVAKSAARNLPARDPGITVSGR